jgi:CelD/BcsL family acetyltransferase involved in cellulose biosynthesis
VRPAGGQVVQRNPCPRLDLERVDAGVGRSANFRSQLGRFRRRLERAGVTFEWLAPGAVEPQVLDRLFALHRSRRLGRELRTSLDDAHHQLLLRCAQLATTGRGPAAVVARRDDEVVGVLLGFWWQDCFSAYQSGWDPAYARDSIGSVLVSEAIRFASAAGARTFDFLRGAEPYKYRFGAVDHYDETVVVPNGLVGALVIAAARVRSARVADDRDASAVAAD